MRLSPRLVALCLLAVGWSHAAGLLRPRQASNDADFTQAVSGLVQAYLGGEVYSSWTAAVATAVPAVENSTDPAGVLVSALAAQPEPAWFTAIFTADPTASFLHSVLTSEISKLRPTGAVNTGSLPTDVPAFPSATDAPPPAGPPVAPSTTGPGASPVSTAPSTDTSGTAGNDTGGVNATTTSDAGAAGLPTGMADLAAAGVLGLVGLAVAF